MNKIISSAVCILLFLLIMQIGRSHDVSSKDNLVPNIAQNQVEALIKNCPQLQKIIWPGNILWTWLAEAFNTSNLGYKIIFSDEPIYNKNALAESGYRSNDVYFIKISPHYREGVKAGKERPAEEILCNAVFELYNAKSFKDYDIINHLARCGIMSRDAYIYATAQEEYFVLRKTNYFYSTVWVDFCEKNNIQLNPKIWHFPLPPTFDQWLSKYPKNSRYPWEIYGNSYDEETRGLAYSVVYYGLKEDELNNLKKKAAAGEVRAQERIGMAFLTREAGPNANNEQEAFEWVLKAANQGDLLSEIHLEWMYRRGVGVEKDQYKSFAWGLKAANQGNSQAEFILGGHYEEGIGVVKDIGEAMRWYKKSADQGYVKAQKYLKYELNELLQKSTVAPALPNK